MGLLDIGEVVYITVFGIVFCVAGVDWLIKEIHRWRHREWTWGGDDYMMFTGSVISSVLAIILGIIFVLRGIAPVLVRVL